VELTRLSNADDVLTITWPLEAVEVMRTAKGVFVSTVTTPLVGIFVMNAVGALEAPSEVFVTPYVIGSSVGVSRGEPTV